MNLLGVIGNLVEGLIQDIEQAHTNTLLDRIELNTRLTETFLSAQSGGMLDYLSKMLAQQGDLTSAFTGWFHNALATLMTTVEDIDSKTGSGGGGGSGSGGGAGFTLNANSLELALQTAISDSGLVGAASSSSSDLSSASTAVDTSTASLSDASSSLSDATTSLSTAATSTTTATSSIQSATAALNSATTNNSDGSSTFSGTAAQQVAALLAAGQPVPAGLAALAAASSTQASSTDSNTTATTANTAAVTQAATSFQQLQITAQGALSSGNLEALGSNPSLLALANATGQSVTQLLLQQQPTNAEGTAGIASLGNTTTIAGGTGGAYSAPQGNGSGIGQVNIPPDPDTGVAGSPHYMLVGQGTAASPFAWVQSGINAGESLGGSALGAGLNQGNNLTDAEIATLQPVHPQRNTTGGLFSNHAQCGAVARATECAWRGKWSTVAERNPAGDQPQSQHGRRARVRVAGRSADGHLPSEHVTQYP